MLLLIILILSLASGYFLPWWMVAVFAFLVSLLLGKTSSGSFWSGFGGVFIAWVLISLFKSIPNNNILAARVSQLFHLSNWILLLLITGLIGGLVGGMAALSGALIKRGFNKDPI